MFVNELHQGGIRAILAYDNTVFDNMVVPDGMDVADVVDHILSKYGDMPLFSPDPSVIKFYVGRWSKRRLALWERYKKAAESEFDPIYNYDRYEEGNSEFNPGTTVEQTISADNAQSYQPDSQSISSGEDKNHYKNHMYGNIGVTTSTQMLNELWDSISRFDVIDYIADDFKAEFCLLCYT